MIWLIVLALAAAAFTFNSLALLDGLRIRSGMTALRRQVLDLEAELARRDQPELEEARLARLVARRKVAATLREAARSVAAQGCNTLAQSYLEDADLVDKVTESTS